MQSKNNLAKKMVGNIVAQRLKDEIMSWQCDVIRNGQSGWSNLDHVTRIAINRYVPNGYTYRLRTCILVHT